MLLCVTVMLHFTLDTQVPVIHDQEQVIQEILSDPSVLICVDVQGSLLPLHLICHPSQHVSASHTALRLALKGSQLLFN